MRFYSQNSIVAALVVLAFLLLCVRPAHASGSVSPVISISSCYVQSYAAANTSSFGPYSSSDACLNQALSVYGGSYSVSGSNCTTSPCSITVTPNGPATAIINFAAGSGTACPANSATPTAPCTCADPYVPSADGASCVQPEITPLQQAANDAKAAALARGASAAAAQAAHDAVMAHPSLSADEQVNIGKAASGAYDYAATVGVPAADSSTIAAQTANQFASSTNPDLVARVLACNILSATAANRYADQVSAGRLADAQSELNRSMALSAVAVAGLGASVLGGPVTAALGLSTALHAGLLAYNPDISNPITAQAVQSAASAAVGSAANPFQVEIITKSTLAAATPAAATPAQTTAAATAAAAVLTKPQPSWNVSSSTTPATHYAAATAGASAAISTSSASPAVQTQAVAAAASAAYSGFDAAAAAAAATAAATSITNGATATQAQAAGTAAAVASTNGAGAGAADAGIAYTQSQSWGNALLGEIRDLLSYEPAEGRNNLPADFVQQTEATSETALNSLIDSAQNGEAADEATWLGTFFFDAPVSSCSPFVGSVLGKSVSIDICQYTEKLRELLGWLFALFGAYTIFQTVFKPKA